MSDERTRHDRLLDRIARGERIEARDEMSGTSRNHAACSPPAVSGGRAIR